MSVVINMCVSFAIFHGLVRLTKGMDHIDVVGLSMVAGVATCFCFVLVEAIYKAALS